MQRDLQTLGDISGIAGNVPAALMTAGTPDQVTAYCKELIEVAGRDGGFVLTSGCGVDHAKTENALNYVKLLQNRIIPSPLPRRRRWGLDL